MDFSKYTTQELKFITSNVELLKQELEKRHIKELDDFPFKVGDVIHTEYNNDNFIIKVKEIYEGHGDIIADEIVIRDDGSFDAYVDEWYEYVKIEDDEIFENLLNIIDRYNDDIQQLNNDVYLKLKNELRLIVKEIL